MDYVFVKDSDGYVFKKLSADVASDEKIISEKEYMLRMRRNLDMAAQEKMQVENRNLIFR